MASPGFNEPDDIRRFDNDPRSPHCGEPTHLNCDICDELIAVDDFPTDSNTCEACLDREVDDDDRSTACPECNGDGWNWLAGARAHSQNQIECDACSGTGLV